MKFKSFILSMVAGDDGLGILSKRVVGVLAFLVVMIVAFVDLFTPFVISPFVFDGLMYIVIACFFFNAIESFSKRSGTNPTTNIQIDEVKNVALDNLQAPKPPTPPTTTTRSSVRQQIAEANTDIQRDDSLEENEIIG